MSSFISTLDRLIYGTGSEALIAPNHRDWLAASNSGGEAWINHHIENAPNSMLTAFEAWIQSQNLPPLIPWNGVDWAEFSKTDNVNAAISHALPAGLDGSFTGITSVEQLGQALRTYYQSLVGGFSWNGDLVKAAYHFRFWSFLKWASLQLRRFRGEIFTPPRLVYDRDGTALSAFPFLSVVNEVHWRWHDYNGMHGLGIGGGSPAGTTITPGYSSAVGQRVTAIHKGDLNTIGDEFFRFHRDHVTMLSNWLERLGQPLPHVSLLM